MRYVFKKIIYFKSEPHSMLCPKCNVLMTWNSWQGPLGGWQCSACGLKIDSK